MLQIRKVLCVSGSPAEPPQTRQWAEWIAAAHQAELEALWITEWGSDELLDYAVREDIDLIVVGTSKGYEPDVPGVIGLAEEVVWGARCPVLAVCHDGRRAGRSLVRRIVVPMDDSRHSDLALRYAKEFGQLAGASLALFHALPVRVHPDSEYPSTNESVEIAGLRDGTVRHLGERLAMVGGPELPAVCVAAEGHPAIGIVSFAQDYRADLIVMASHGDTDFRQAVIGSVTEAVLRRIPCPVLVVKSFGRKLLRAGFLPKHVSHRPGLAPA